MGGRDGVLGEEGGGAGERAGVVDVDDLLFGWFGGSGFER